MDKDSALIVLYTSQYKERRIRFSDIPKKYQGSVYERLDDIDRARAEEEMGR